VGLDELHRLDEHTRRTTAGIVHTAAVWLEHLDQQSDHATGSIELAALLALGTRKLRQKVLVHAAQYILGPGVGVAHADAGHQVNQLA
jgi:hypothetical protein